MTDMTHDRLQELRRIAAETAPGTYEWRIIETTLALTIETALALLDRIEALEQERDAARAEAERWRKKYEVLRAGVERVADDLHMAADEAHDNWRITAAFTDRGRSIGLEEAEQMVRRVLTEAGVATSEPPRHHWADAEWENGGADRLGVDGQGEPHQNPGVNAQTGGSSEFGRASCRERVAIVECSLSR